MVDDPNRLEANCYNRLDNSWGVRPSLSRSDLVRYVWNLLIAFDQGVNTLFGGDPDETISSRMGKWARNQENNRGLKKPIYWVANKIVELFEKDHFKKSIEEDEGKDEVIN